MKPETASLGLGRFLSALGHLRQNRNELTPVQRIDVLAEGLDALGYSIEYLLLRQRPPNDVERFVRWLAHKGWEPWDAKKGGGHVIGDWEELVAQFFMEDQA